MNSSTLSLAPVGRCRHSVVVGGSAWLVLVMVTSAWSADGATDSSLNAKSVLPDAAPAELSVAPMDHIEYPDDRPKWLDEKPVGRGRDHRIVITSLPSDTAEESLEELRWMQRAAIATYVAQLVDAGGEFDFYSPTDDEIAKELVSKRYSGEVTQGGTTRYESAIELHFDPTKRQQIRAAWKNVEVGDRLRALGGMTGVGLVFLMATNGLLGVVGRRFSTTS